jgi:hypothetical protein
MVQREGGSNMIRCSQCGRGFDRQAGDQSVASISSSIMGDEYIESYYFCNQCEVYTVGIYHDRFLGDDEVFVRGPVPKPEGDAKVELIRQCSEPWNKKCRCNAHQSYFGGGLD